VKRIGFLPFEYNARMLETIARHIAPAIGWRPNADAEDAGDQQAA
jgi:hypothetical protein